MLEAPAVDGKGKKPPKPRKKNEHWEAAVRSLRSWARLWLAREEYDPVPGDVKAVIKAMGEGWTEERIGLVIRGGRTSDFHRETGATLPLLLHSQKAAAFEEAGRRFAASDATPGPTPGEVAEREARARENDKALLADLRARAAQGESYAAATLRRMEASA